MLDGLEITEIELSELYRNSDFRFESEFYLQKLASNSVFLKGEEITSFVQYGTSKELNEENDGYPILRLNEFSSYFIGEPKKYCAIMNKIEFEALRLLKNDVLICRTNGNPNLVGKAALVTSDTNFAYASYLFKVRPNINFINSATLTVFLNSKIGREQINKYSMTGNQTNFSPAKFRQIDIPVLSFELQEQIEKIVFQSHKLSEESKTTYKTAEQILLYEIGFLGKPDEGYTGKNLRDWEDDELDRALAWSAPSPREEVDLLQAEWDEILAEQARLAAIFDYDGQKKHFQQQESRLNDLAHALPQAKTRLQYIHNNRNIAALELATMRNYSTKTLAESFLESGRLDAEYYQEKYDELERMCRENAVSVKRIKEIRTVNRRGLQPNYVEEGDLDVINSRHVLATILDYDNFEKTSLNNWQTQEVARVYYGDILTYTTGANIGRTQSYLSDTKALASNHVNILRIQNENSIYVAFVMNSIVGQYQTEKLSAGSAQQELYPKDIDMFYIPFIEDSLQTVIEEKVIESKIKYQESKRLLALAKSAVEVAIEQDEAVAVSLIAKHFS